jgi:hypothetical protein
MTIRISFASILAITLILVTTGLLAQEDEAVIPGPPTNVKVSVVGYAVHIEWEAPDEDSEAVTGYEIVRAHASYGPYRKIVRVPHNVLSYRDDTTRSTSRYFYRVRAEANGSYSDYSSPVSAELPEVQNLK